MKKFTINIHDTEYNIKLSIRTLMTYEQLSEKNYTDITTMQDMLIYMFSALVSSNSELPFDFNSFIELIDDEPAIFEQFLSNIIPSEQLEVKKK